MVVEFSYRFEDYREAVTAMRARQAKLERADTKSWQLPMILATLLVLTVLAGWSGSVIANALIPGFLFAGSILFMMACISTDGWRRKVVLILGMGAMLAVAVGLALWQQRIQAAQPAGFGALTAANRDEVSWLDPLLPHVSWLVLLGVISILLGQNVRKGLRKAWDGQPALHRPHTLEATPERMVITDALARNEYQWLAFSRFEETPGLFVLYLSDYLFHMVPKRAFANEAHLDEFRRLLEEMLGERPKAFPVLPVKSN